MCSTSTTQSTLSGQADTLDRPGQPFRRGCLEGMQILGSAATAYTRIGDAFTVIGASAASLTPATRCGSSVTARKYSSGTNACCRRPSSRTPVCSPRAVSAFRPAPLLRPRCPTTLPPARSSWLSAQACRHQTVARIILGDLKKLLSLLSDSLQYIIISRRSITGDMWIDGREKHLHSHKNYTAGNDDDCGLTGLREASSGLSGVC